MNLIKRYIWWTEERGSLHYDVMVTLILVFLFVSPRFINFKAKPMPDVVLPSESVVVKAMGETDGEPRFVYEIPADKLSGPTSDAGRRKAILDVVQSMAGPVTLEDYSAIRDGGGHVAAYEAVVHRRALKSDEQDDVQP